MVYDRLACYRVLYSNRQVVALKYYMNNDKNLVFQNLISIEI